MQRAKLFAPDAAGDDRFSREGVAISGDMVSHSLLAEEGGAAYVFALDGETWALEQRFVEGDDDPFHDRFGNELVAGDDRLYVGCDADDTLGANTGTVYVYERTGGLASWTLQTMLFPADVMHSDSFGIAIALDDNVLLITREGANRVPSSAGAILAFIADPCVCPDTTGDGIVGITDFLAVLSAWGPCAGPCDADFDGDGVVGINDLLLLLAAWGPC